MKPKPELTPHRFSVEAYEAMIASGVLRKDDRVELIEGVVATKGSM